MTTNNIIGAVPAESDNLALHVQLCEQRYLQLINKFDQVDRRFEKIEQMLIEIKANIGGEAITKYKMYLSWSGVVVVTLTGLVVHLLSK